MTKYQIETLLRYRENCKKKINEWDIGVLRREILEDESLFKYYAIGASHMLEDVLKVLEIDNVDEKE